MSTRPSQTHYSSSSSTVSSSSYTSSDSDLSIRTSMDAPPPVASVEVLRCLRCHRHVETTSTDDIASTGMIRVGFNLYYCQKCAVARKRSTPSGSPISKSGLWEIDVATKGVHVDESRTLDSDKTSPPRRSTASEPTRIA
ncbi:hypothetical protein F5X99DRAFT_410755 [Biscogniauxia marginata]|nr:hypothetical protein F5X99DRAFT_410755 [Biscogniauxia marginata]